MNKIKNSTDTSLKLKYKRKIPFFAISLAAGLINIGVHEELGYYVTLETYTIGERITIAFQSLWVYLSRIIWPFQLTHFV